jgi:hypothetical protein
VSAGARLAAAVLLTAFFALQLGGPAQGQETPYCYVSGRILDSKSSGAIGGAIITVANRDIGVEKKAVSFDDGYYNMSLQAGLYAMNITATTYKTYTGTVNLTGNMTLDFQLEKRPVASTCAVTGAVMAVPLAALGMAAVLERRRWRG